MRTFALHYFLRPDHRDVADIWLAAGGHVIRNVAPSQSRHWLFEHIEDLHASGAQTTCAFNRHTGGLAGFITVNPADGELDQIVVANSDRGSGVASLLMREAKRIARGPMTMRINENNSRAIRFCEREGFRKMALTQAGAGNIRIWNMGWRPVPAKTANPTTD